MKLFSFSFLFFFFDCSRFYFYLFIYLFWKKMKFWDHSDNFYYFGEKIRSRRHLPHLSKLTNLFSKNMSRFRANNLFLFYSQLEEKMFLTLLLWSLQIFSIGKCLRSNFSPLISIIMSILILFQIFSYNIILLFYLLKMAIEIFLT